MLQVGRLDRLYDLEGKDRPRECDPSLAELLLSEDGVRKRISYMFVGARCLPVICFFYPKVVFAEQQTLQERDKRAFSLPSDPLWSTQWPWVSQSIHDVILI